MIEWNVSPEIFRIGPFALRWYSLMFIFSFLLGYIIIRKILLIEKKPEKYLDELFLYVFAGLALRNRSVQTRSATTSPSYPMAKMLCQRRVRQRFELF